MSSLERIYRGDPFSRGLSDPQKTGSIKYIKWFRLEAGTSIPCLEFIPTKYSGKVALTRNNFLN